MVAQNGVFEPPTVGRWAVALGELHERIGHRFARSEARERVGITTVRWTLFRYATATSFAMRSS